MDRREFLKYAGMVGADCATQPVPVLTRHPGPEPRQAIIILGESVRYDMLNCNKQTGLKTPNFDRIAASGISFDHAYNCQPVCAPARSAIWTGLYPHTSGVWANSMPLGDTTHTIGQRLTDQGVHCAFIGKWHLSGTDYFDTGRPAAGWDKGYWYDMRNYLEELTPADRIRSRKITTGNDPTWTTEMCYGYRCTERALDFIDKHQHEDFLLVISYDEPHGPSLCPAEFTLMYKDFVFPGNNNVNDSLQNKPEEQRVWAGPRSNKDLSNASGWGAVAGNQHYFGSHAFIDHEVGRVLDSIEANTPKAMILYTADHGVFLNSHRLTDKGPAMYEEITHVPFLVSWPGHTPPNSRSKSLVSHINIAGTMMEFFGFDVPKILEGGSALPLFNDSAAIVNKEVFIEWGRYEVDHDVLGGYQPIRCVCDGRYKLTINLMTTDELYDLELDSLELKNLIDSTEHSAMRNDLHDRLLNWMNISRDPFRGYYWGRRAWRPEFPVTWANAGFTRQREDDGYLPRELDYDTGLTMNLATRPK
jgi:uncharacterized sulfatase